MKQTAIDVSRFEGMSELSMEQLQCIEGGIDEGTSFWYDVFYTIGATAKGIITFAKTAMDYQSSLPPNLKK
ncbi:hypothetical protein L0U88_11555 [Flavihumibacter sp. RY-1]|uniref:Bacteriocin-like protein n=1 Tax=Flavihumibacter fluminis TaxID=2909236 RepID=A0ABS9BJF4_9BACT|nr:hypothetical protein [Flavihumibacter fluminis]MCF1715263.1 hypothetical protein [Flavihumibacter fluminis]